MANYFVNGYWWLSILLMAIVAILLMAIVAILLMAIVVILLMAIVDIILMVIGCYSINDYLWLFY